ncbi:hypothetical protein [Streptomyces sp. NPDC059262]|uniref:hypothetical protein n=1 Tax=Streptomyces sp. NPDC059262 TaxID=3346797 RepID=UPI0036B901ED
MINAATTSRQERGEQRALDGRLLGRHGGHQAEHGGTVGEDADHVSVNVLVKPIRDYIASWNENAKPLTWTAATDEILVKVDSSRPA